MKEVVPITVSPGRCAANLHSCWQIRQALPWPVHLTALLHHTMPHLSCTADPHSLRAFTGGVPCLNLAGQRLCYRGSKV